MSEPGKPLKQRTPVEMVRDGIAAKPDETLLTFVETAPDGTFLEETRSYRQLLENGKKVAAALASEGMKSQDSFALLMANHPEFIDAMIGSELAGTVFVPIDPRTRGDRLAYMLRFAKCRGAVVSRAALPALAEVAPQLTALEWIWVLGDEPVEQVAHARVKTFPAAIAAGKEATPDPGPDLARPMQFLYTSGTTGDPKAMLAPYARYALVASLGPVLQIRPDDRLYTGLSLTHANAQLITLGISLAMGLPLVISRRFTKSKLWDIVGHYGCTVFNLLGGMTVAIFAEPPAPHDRKHKVRMVLSAGMPVTMWRAFEERFGLRVFEFYGAAEGGLTLNPPGAGPIGSIGKAPAGSICAILDEEDREVAPGEHGEICFRPENGSAPPVHYFANPTASEAKTRGGWFRSGDIGYKDKHGWVYFSHRAGTAIRRNGDFIDPGHIETEIAAIDGVADVHVYGVATTGNTPGEKEVVAAIVPERESFDPRTVFSHCRNKLGTAASPSFVQIVPEIPKTASEKPMDRHLVSWLTASDARLFDASGPAKIQLTGEK